MENHRIVVRIAQYIENFPDHRCPLAPVEHELVPDPRNQDIIDIRTQRTVHGLASVNRKSVCVNCARGVRLLVPSQIDVGRYSQPGRLHNPLFGHFCPCGVVHVETSASVYQPLTDHASVGCGIASEITEVGNTVNVNIADSPCSGEFSDRAFLYPPVIQDCPDLPVIDSIYLEIHSPVGNGERGLACRYHV